MSTIRRVPHDGQKPRPLHENATTQSCLQASIFHGINTGVHQWGQFLKDYVPTHF